MLSKEPLSSYDPLISNEDIRVNPNAKSECIASRHLTIENAPSQINPDVEAEKTRYNLGNQNHKHFKYLLLMLFLLMVGTSAKAQIDPTLAAMIMTYTSKAEGALKSQQKVMATQSPAFILTADQINQTVTLQRQYNEYLESFRSIVVYGAQIYGFYQQITRMITTFKDFLNQLAKTPDNALALALSSNSSNIYLQLITQSIDICNDLRKICFSDIKMTEVDRLEIVFQIKPKLRTMTKQLRNLTLAVKYTTFSRLWKSFDLDNNKFELDKNSISQGAFRRWRDNVK